MKKPSFVQAGRYQGEKCLWGNSSLQTDCKHMRGSKNRQSKLDQRRPVGKRWDSSHLLKLSELIRSILRDKKALGICLPSQQLAQVAVDQIKIDYVGTQRDVSGLRASNLRYLA
ncbi:hypothetical protein AVEN_151644-1 [Araneus ventricosus]|uniref:Uncharacterized protein n=1 Tax=Araneus ventricosus TaxID=182803 RepID=A0A4Y2WCB9_ARAVE|nr:hypothetical protein AVEN_32247-1 [Araneus ventricosus]GBO33914.1 hypothetical protein AVEN_151644-1 [Araneus ventricosus]